MSMYGAANEEIDIRDLLSLLMRSMGLSKIKGQYRDRLLA